MKLDVASYYERIYHHKLQKLLERRNVPGAITSSLIALLRRFADGDSHGIPQGSWASDYLGNACVIYLDEYLRSKDLYFIRFVDDYRIFCNSEREGRLILKDCCGVLRPLGLNVQGSKTSIITVDRLDPELKPSTEQLLALRTEKIKVVIKRIEEASMGEDLVVESEEWEENLKDAALTDEDIKDFERLWTEAVDQEDLRIAILNFALAGLTAGASPTAEQYVLDHLDEYPHLASTTSRYLISLGWKSETADRLLTFIESRECIHEWQQMWLLQYFRGADLPIESFKTRLWGILKDPARHPLVRSMIAEVIAMRGTDADGEEISRLFTAESNPHMRRSLLLGYRLLPASERNYAVSYLLPNDWYLKLVGRLVKSQATL